ncbi:carbamoyltransferase C-terminal domain-containing protein, partial [Aeromonas veronii]|uniref:carbamoyltransferase C-terminal domain-containing protein n=1 Tax=Aeromonas veronii TaxID=654 RepID=UPI0038B5D9DC
YMIQAFDLRPEKRATVPAVIHPADGTTRPQIVEKETSPRYHRLLSMFEELTGVPVLLNTSFNDSGEPIVNTPQEALD